MKALHTRILFFCLLLVCAGLVHAQTTHYPAGVEGIKGSSLPPPGLYIRDYNYTYFSNQFKGEGPPSFDLFANVNAPRLVFITKYKFFGGYYGADILVPLAYQDLDQKTARGSDFGLGDIFLEPITLSWHLKQADISLGYGLWAPTGNWDSKSTVLLGKGYWTQMYTGGVTYYPDKKKAWSISALNRLEFSSRRSDWLITPGQYWTVEWGLAKSLSKTVDIGFAGYSQMQSTLSTGASRIVEKERAVGLGPEITLVCPKLGLSTSIRYLHEVGVQQRPKGDAFNVTFTRLIKEIAQK
jgi:hypothetical protein